MIARMLDLDTWVLYNILHHLFKPNINITSQCLGGWRGKLNFKISKKRYRQVQ